MQDKCRGPTSEQEDKLQSRLDFWRENVHQDAKDEEEQEKHEQVEGQIEGEEGSVAQGFELEDNTCPYCGETAEDFEDLQTHVLLGCYPFFMRCFL